MTECLEIFVNNHCLPDRLNIVNYMDMKKFLIFETFRWMVHRRNNNSLDYQQKWIALSNNSLDKLRLNNWCFTETTQPISTQSDHVGWMRNFVVWFDFNCYIIFFFKVMSSCIKKIIWKDEKYYSSCIFPPILLGSKVLTVCKLQ